MTSLFGGKKAPQPQPLPAAPTTSYEPSPAVAPVPQSPTADDNAAAKQQRADAERDAVLAQKSAGRRSTIVGGASSALESRAERNRKRTLG